MSNVYKRLGELLVSKGLISNLQLSIVLAAQATSNRRIGDILVERGFVTEEQIARCLAEQYGYPLVDPTEAVPQPNALMALPPDQALSMAVLPLAVDDDEFRCALSDPVDIVATDDLAKLLRRRITVMVAPHSRLLSAIRRWYGLDEPVAQELFGELASVPPRFTDAEPRRKFGKICYFDARDRTLDRPVTLASIPKDTPEEKAQFWLVQSAARASSNSICAVHDWFDYLDHRWTVFERLSGETLEHILKTRGPRAVPQAAELLSAIAEGVDASNQAGGWCGLVCPANVLVRRSGAVLVPFTMPSEQYSCPEIQCGEPGSTASDVFALGTLLWETVTGSNPHTGGWAVPSANDDIPPALADVIKKCVAEDPDARYASAIQLATAMRAYNWFAVSAAKTVKDDSQLDREALLDRISVPAKSAPTSFWNRLFGRKAA